jgi:hypothetical protein
VVPSETVTDMKDGQESPPGVIGLDLERVGVPGFDLRERPGTQRVENLERIPHGEPRPVEWVVLPSRP